jgi:hypothetical protein
MSHNYIPPVDVVSPRRQWSLLSVLFDQGESGVAVALGRWEGQPVLAMRWNGSDDNPIGNPQSRGLPTWFIIPREFRDPILSKLRVLAPEQEALAQELFIQAIVVTNTIADPGSRRAIQNAVLQGLGQRPDNESWTVRIFEPQSGPEYVIKIEGANGFRWEHTFLGGHEQTPDFIRKEVQKATSHR